MKEGRSSDNERNAQADRWHGECWLAEGAGKVAFSPEGPDSAGLPLTPPPGLMCPSAKWAHCGFCWQSGSVLACGQRQALRAPGPPGTHPREAGMRGSAQMQTPAQSVPPSSSRQLSPRAALPVSTGQKQPLGPGVPARAGTGEPEPEPEPSPGLDTRDPGCASTPGPQTLSRQSSSAARSLRICSDPQPEVGVGTAGAIFQGPSHENRLRIPLFLATELRVPVPPHWELKLGHTSAHALNRAAASWHPLCSNSVLLGCLLSRAGGILFTQCTRHSLSYSVSHCLACQENGNRLGAQWVCGGPRLQSWWSPEGSGFSWSPGKGQSSS